MLPETPPLLEYVHPIRSRYGETDKMGYVYYGRYLEYFEEARTEMLRSVGLPYASMEDNGIMLPVTKASLEYVRPIFYDELIHIHVMLFRRPQTRLETWYTISGAENGKIRTRGFVELCFVSAETRRPITAPDFFQNSLNQLIHPYDG